MPSTTLIKVPLKNIIILPGRARKTFGKIQELSESIKRVGNISPLCVTEDKDRPGFYTLNAGERRYRASILAGLSEVPVISYDSLSLIERKIVELEENVCREELDWQDQAELHRQIDELKKKVNPNWTQKQTAEMTHLSPAMISRQIDVAKKLRDNPQLKEKIGKLDFNSATKVIANEEKIKKVERLQAQGKLQITTDLLNIDCRTGLKGLADRSIDLLLTDPPYGLEALEDIREGNGSVMPGHVLMSNTHNSNLPDVLKLLESCASELVRVLKPGAHAYVFCAFQYVGDFIRALAPLEFQPPLLIWDRGRNTTPGYGYNYLNRTEAIIYLHNPPRSRRLNKNMFNVFEHPTVPKSLRVYPTEKPQSLLKELISQSSNLGDTVLDICAGSASTLKAARSLGRKSIGFEINEDSWKIAQLHLSESDRPDQTKINFPKGSAA